MIASMLNSVEVEQNTPRKRRTITEAREARLYRFQVDRACFRRQRPNRRELGALSYKRWRYQFIAQMGRCATCERPFTQSRRLSSNTHNTLVCQKCWWGEGNTK